MLWRLATGLIVLFWAVMTALLVRNTYFPEESEQGPVPVRLILQRYAATPTLSNTFQLQHAGSTCGNVSMSVIEWKDPASAQHRGFTWQVGGHIELDPQSSPPARVTWNFSGDYTDDEHWERMTLGARSSVTDTFVSVQWKQGLELPMIEVRKGDKLIMDTKAAMEQAKSSPMATGLGGLSGLGGLGSFMPGFLGGNKTVSLDSLVRLNARNASVRLGGRIRKAFVLNISLMGLYPSRAWFTEAGEVIRVDLPQD